MKKINASNEINFLGININETALSLNEVVIEFIEMKTKARIEISILYKFLQQKLPLTGQKTLRFCIKILCFNFA